MSKQNERMKKKNLKEEKNQKEVINIDEPDHIIQTSEV